MKRVINDSYHKFITSIHIQYYRLLSYIILCIASILFSRLSDDLVINTCHYSKQEIEIYRIRISVVSLITRRYLNHATARTVMRNSRVVYELTRVVYEGHISMRERLTLKCLHPLVGESSLCYTLHTNAHSWDKYSLCVTRATSFVYHYLYSSSKIYSVRTICLHRTYPWYTSWRINFSLQIPKCTLRVFSLTWHRYSWNRSAHVYFFFFTYSW